MSLKYIQTKPIFALKHAAQKSQIFALKHELNTEHGSHYQRLKIKYQDEKSQMSEEAYTEKS
jgi:hypothetical protein